MPRLASLPVTAWPVAEVDVREVGKINVYFICLPFVVFMLVT